MAVVLADRALTVVVRSHPWERDARGVPMPTGNDTLTTRGPWPGAAEENADQTWVLRVDPRAWPVRAGDTITDDQGHTFVVYGEPKLHQIPGFPAVDYIETQATLNPPEVP